MTKLILVEAPARRKPVNWYRVGAWSMLSPVVVFFLYCAYLAFPHFIRGHTADDVTAFGGVLWAEAMVFIGYFILFPALIAAVALVLRLAWKALEIFVAFIEWWGRKIKEADRRAGEYTD